MGTKRAGDRRMKEKVISHQLNVSLKECMFESNKSTLGLVRTKMAEGRGTYVVGIKKGLGL